MTVCDHVLCTLCAHFGSTFGGSILSQCQNTIQTCTPCSAHLSPPPAFIFLTIYVTRCQLVLLVIAHAQYYPNQPFCPWLLGTEFVENVCGLVRMILPNFTHAELLKMVQHIMVHQRILLSGKFKEKQEKQSGVG